MPTSQKHSGGHEFTIDDWNSHRRERAQYTRPTTCVVSTRALPNPPALPEKAEDSEGSKKMKWTGVDPRPQKDT